MGPTKELRRKVQVDSQNLEQGCRMTHAGIPSFFGLGLARGPSGASCQGRVLGPCFRHLGSAANVCDRTYYLHF